MGRATVSVITPLAIDQLGCQIDRKAAPTREKIQAASLVRLYRLRSSRIASLNDGKIDALPKETKKNTGHSHGRGHTEAAIPKAGAGLRRVPTGREGPV